MKKDRDPALVLQEALADAIDVPSFLRSLEDDPVRIKEILEKFKNDNRPQLIEAGRARFEDELTQEMEESIEKAVDAYLEKIAEIATGGKGEVPVAQSWFGRNKQTVGILVLICGIALVTLLFALLPDRGSKLPTGPQGAKELLIPATLEVRHDTGAETAEVIILAPAGATNVLLYENSKMVKRWTHGGELGYTVSHIKGKYIYFVETFYDNEKSASNSTVVDFGKPSE